MASQKLHRFRNSVGRIWIIKFYHFNQHPSRSCRRFSRCPHIEDSWHASSRRSRFRCRLSLRVAVFWIPLWLQSVMLFEGIRPSW
jgi:hypothetical protein